jgi:hypothetical protein
MLDNNTARSATPQVLREGQTAHIESQKVQLGDSLSRNASKSRFVRVMPTGASLESRRGDAYAKLVLSMRPAVYYRMERPIDTKDRNTIRDFGPGEHHGVLHLGDEYGGDPWRPGRFGTAVSLRGPDAGDYAIVPDYPKALDGRLTVAAWVMITNPRAWCPIIAANWGGKLLPGRLSTGQFHIGLFDNGVLAAKVTQRNGQCTVSREREDSVFPTWRWQHVAFTVDGAALRLYRNGIEVASEPCEGILPRPPMASLAIGCRTANDGLDVDHESPCYWCGRIDELVIFNRALSAEEIKSLCGAVKETARER